MVSIREDFEGVVYVSDGVERVELRAGDTVPEGVVLGSHLVDRSHDGEDSDSETPPDPLREGEPHRVGREATRAAWLKYAVDELDLVVPEKAKRDEIIALVDAHHAAQEGE